MKISDNTDILNIYWEDRENVPYKVGFLAQADKDFYTVFNTKNRIKDASEIGYKGIPGFIPGEVYKSNRLFDFWAVRLLNKKSDIPLKELKETQGRSMVDSFFVLDDIPEEMKEELLSALEQAYETQQKLNQMRAALQK